MAAPNYTTDLISLAIAKISVDAGTWDESTDAGWDDAGSMVADVLQYYNNTECVSAQFTKTGIGTILYEHTASITVPTDGAVLVHHVWASQAALETFANGGVRIIIGNGLGVFYAWKAAGRDFSPAPRGGWSNFAINPGIGSPDYTVGTPATPYDTFGMAISASAQSRGNPNAVGAIKYGRCESRFTDGDGTNGYATFSGFAAVDNLITNRWNLIDPRSSGYGWQGLMSLGLSGTPVDFRDQNKGIAVINTINVTSAFNRIEIHNASSNIEWTAISITAEGTVSKGEFEMIDNATLSFDSCTFTDMSTFIFQSNAELISTIFRRCGQVTQGGATVTGCIFDDSPAAVSLVVSALANVTGCTFNSDGSNHAVNLGTISSDVSLNWDNFLNDYATSNGSTGNEAILVSVDSGITLTINVIDGADTPTYYNTGTGTVNVVSGQRSFKFTINPSITAYEWRIYSVTAVGSLAGSVELAGEESATADNQTYNYSYSTDQPIAVQIISQPDEDYEEKVDYYVLKNSNQDVPVVLTKDTNN